MPTYFVSYAHTGRDGTGSGFGRAHIVADCRLTTAEQLRAVELTLEKENNITDVVLLNFRLLQED